ncbi:restriction endonuclease subunit S [Escherichia coli]|uniref:restriction endonuclease subunit S n=1 Tax=Escherichia coli TaxID=562 RepID=UPI00191C8108|nr:restriction endonuclease subunit S [Escherichia coli]EIF8298624.1 restriction endonuclease subunit S [Escherichia coli]HCQ3819930.1 restriction endonuclease subunit S [Escherichia coli]
MILMKRTPLSQLASVSAGQGAPKDHEFSENGVPFVRAGSLKALLSGKNESELELVGPETAKLRKLKIYPKGTILFAKSGMSATKDRVYVLQNPAHVVSHLATLIPKDGVYVDYLRLALKHFPPSSLIKDLAYPAIGLGEIENFEVPVPEEFDNQIRISHLLSKVEGLIAQRKQHLQQLDDLLNSIFLEMFGDPVRNEKGWRKHQFSDLLEDIESGKSPKCEARQADVEEWGVLKLGAITRCRFDEKENKALPKDIAPSLRDEVRAGDLLFSRKNTYDLVAACAYVFKTRPKLLMPDLIFRFSFKQNADVNPIFMWRLFVNDSQRKAIQSLAAGAAGSMPNISKGNLKTVSLALPPLHLQNQFSSIVVKIEAIKSRYQQSLTDLECLFSALSQNAFNGELDLTRVPMPKPSTQDATAVFQEDQTSMSATVIPTLPAINLPDTGNLLAALENSEARKTLITEWLEAYRTQLVDTPFSLQQFMELAQSRLADLNPDNDLVMGASDYEYMKTWVFEALAAGTLKQVFDDAGNRIELKAALEHNPI